MYLYECKSIGKYIWGDLWVRAVVWGSHRMGLRGDGKSLMEFRRDFVRKF